MHIKIALFAYVFDSKPLQITYFLNANHLSIVQTLIGRSIQNKREVCMQFNASLTMFAKMVCLFPSIYVYVFLCILTSTLSSLQTNLFICCLSHIKCTQNMPCILYTCIYDYNAEELASLSPFMEINGFSHFIYRFFKPIFFK